MVGSPSLNILRRLDPRRKSFDKEMKEGKDNGKLKSVAKKIKPLDRRFRNM